MLQIIITGLKNLIYHQKISGKCFWKGKKVSMKELLLGGSSVMRWYDTYVCSSMFTRKQWLQGDTEFEV